MSGDDVKGMSGDSALLHLLQLTSSTLPVGAYSYSEGIESLVESGKIDSRATLMDWLVQELRYGATRLEAAAMVRSYRAIEASNLDELSYWNRWLSAARETEELRLQSWQMGRSLLRLFQDLQPQIAETQDLEFLWKDGCNFAIAFGMVAAYWRIDLRSAGLGYLYSWATNLVSAGIKLIPLGQTDGQKLLLALQPVFEQSITEILILQDDELSTCGWGLALASMTHETLYSRLFRS